MMKTLCCIIGVIIAIILMYGRPCVDSRTLDKPREIQYIVYIPYNISSYNPIGGHLSTQSSTIAAAPYYPPEN